jgi:uncharacterized protein with PIN domain
MPGAVSVDIDGLVEAHDHNNSRGMQRMGAERVHRSDLDEGDPIPSILGRGERVAILVSGIDYNYVELRDNY